MLTLRNAYRLVRDVKNWWFPLQYWLGKRNCVVRFRNGVKQIYVPEFFQISALSEHEDPFWFLDELEGRDVVDIGASVGDTAIRFVRMGARRVVALEPFPKLYRLAKENLRLNNITSVILLNQGLSGHEGKLLIPDDYLGDPSNEAKDFGRGTTVGLTTLERLVQEFSLRDAVLKLNCEGCEYDSLLAADATTLAAFREIILYFHKGKYPLAEFLVSKGFELEVIYDHPVQGTLYFRRQAKTVASK